MLSQLEDLINGILKGPFVIFGDECWEILTDIAQKVMIQTPEQFSPDAWNYVVNTLYPWVLTIGVSMVNVFFILSFFKAVSNIRENITLELCVESMMKLVVLNVLMIKGLDIFNTIFSMATAMVGEILKTAIFAPYHGDLDLGGVLANYTFGFLYMIIAAVCGAVILITVMSRYLKLYVVMVFYPLAMPTLIGGHGIDGTAYAWIRQFLSISFEIVAIALVMAIGGRILASVQPLFEASSSIGSAFDGADKLIGTTISMILMATGVRGASNLMNKTFNLH